MCSRWQDIDSRGAASWGCGSSGGDSSCARSSWPGLSGATHHVATATGVDRWKDSTVRDGRRRANVTYYCIVVGCGRNHTAHCLVVRLAFCSLHVGVVPAVYARNMETNVGGEGEDTRGIGDKYGADYFFFARTVPNGLFVISSRMRNVYDFFVNVNALLSVSYGARFSLCGMYGPWFFANAQILRLGSILIYSSRVETV